jgi:hypothetical protein
MAHFTQLDLSGTPDKKPQTKAQHFHSDPTKLSSPQKTAVLVSSLIATSLLGIFLLESGCSKESGKTATIAPPNQTETSQPLATAPVITAASATQPPAKKKSRQRKLSASTYSNSLYGVSFRYPKYGSLKEGDQANLKLEGLGPLEMNFVQPGGTAISAVELPRKLYAGTDLHAAFFNVSVHPKLSSADCEQFAFPETGDLDNDPVAILKTKVGANEFHAVEGFAEKENNQANVKYYHAFQNGSCYEFALGLETASETTPDEIKPTIKPAVRPVDRNEIFRQLNWILSTVKIQPIATPEKTIPEVASGTAITPTNAAITEAH